MKAVKSTVNYNGIELEVYQLPNGEYHLSKTQVGKVIEKHDKSVREFLEGKSPEALLYKDYKFLDCQIEGNNAKHHAVPLEMAYQFWLYWANKNDVLAQNLITKLGDMNYEDGVKLFGKNFKQHIIFTSKRTVKLTKPEKEIQLKLNETLNGLLEVSTPVGKIDILTDTLLIEIKKAKDWKAAIGQLLMYGHYYPKHQKVLYLFNVNNKFDLDLVNYLCNDFNITVSTSVKTLLKQYEKWSSFVCA